ncbi:hypothetical protein ES703_68816 [subsurface metagenome]
MGKVNSKTILVEISSIGPFQERTLSDLSKGLSRKSRPKGFKNQWKSYQFPVNLPWISQLSNVKFLSFVNSMLKLSAFTS